jgi:hypothetical protein
MEKVQCTIKTEYYGSRKTSQLRDTAMNVRRILVECKLNTLHSPVIVAVLHTTASNYEQNFEYSKSYRIVQKLMDYIGRLIYLEITES